MPPGLLLAAILMAGWFWWDSAIVLKGQRIPVGYSADGKYLATLDSHGRGHLWEAHTGALRDDMGGHVQGLELPFSPDGRYHVAIRPVDPARTETYYQSEASVVETQTGRTLLSFRCWHGAVYGGIGFTPDASRFFAVDTPEWDGRYSSKIWELPTGQEIRNFEQVYAKAISPDGKTLAVFEKGNRGVEDGQLSLLQVDDERKVLTLPDTGSEFVSATFSSDGGRLAVCWEGGSSTSLMRIFDVQSGEELISKRIPWGCFRNPVFYSDDKLIRLHQQPPMMRLPNPESVWSTEPEKFVVIWAADSVSQNGRWAVSVFRQEGSPDGEQTIRICSATPDAASRQPLGKADNMTQFTVTTGAIQAVYSRITDNGRYVVTIGSRAGMSGRSTVLALVDCRSQKLLRWLSIDKSEWPINNFEVSPDGSTVAVGIRGADARVDKIKIYAIRH